jgi:tRNA-dihydrouridine synthase 1
MINVNEESKYIYDQSIKWNELKPYDFWSALGNPRYVCAPMVDQSELPFRLICRKYGADLTFTPMIHSVLFSNQETYRKKWISDISQEDQPCFVQFCGHDPEILLNAAKLVQDKCPCVDINLGCPQGIAKRGFYGSFLLEDTDLVLKIAGYLSNNLKCGLSCKIRLFPDLERSYELVKGLEEKGIKVLTVHGRTKEQNKQFTAEADWKAIKAIKEMTTIPIIANGGIETYDDIDRCFKATNCDAVMSAEKLLENPFLFSGENHNIDDIALEYINLAKSLNTEVSFVRSHLYKFYYQACKMDMSYNQKLGDTINIEDFITLGEEIKEFRKEVPNEDKFGWYVRYRNAIEESNTNNNLDNLNSIDICDISSMFG